MIEGKNRGDATYGVDYAERYLDYTWFREWRGRIGYERTTCKTRLGFPSRAAAWAAANDELKRRIKQGWVRISREAKVALDKSQKRR